MTIRITEQLIAEQNAPALLFPHTDLYLKRAERLKQLSKNHPLKEYLLFIAQLVSVQQQLLENYPLEKPFILSQEQTPYFPLHCQTWQLTHHWLILLKGLLERMKINANDSTRQSIEWLEKASDNELTALAHHLLQENFHLVPNDKALFIWAALMVYWRQLSQFIPHHGIMENASNLNRCPVCHSAPVASVVQGGKEQGLRYLHCAMCETKWHSVRAKCTHCEQTEHLNYFMFDDENADTRAESCEDCQSFLKIFYLEKNPQLDTLADDLATLFLDVQLDEKGYAKSGFNPYFFTALA